MSQGQFWALMIQIALLNYSIFDLKAITHSLRRQVRTIEEFLGKNLKSFKQQERKQEL